MVIYLKYYRCRCLRWFKYKFMYNEKEKAAIGLEPVTAKPFLPNLYLDYFDKLEASDFFFRYSLSHGFPHDRNNLRSPDVPAGLCHKAFHYPQRHNHTS